MKYISRIFSLILLCSMTFLFSACQYDDGPIKDRLDKVETDVKALQEQVKMINDNVSGLQALVDALNSKVQIQKVEKIDGGIQISFTDGGIYTITNGNSPAINVKKDETSGKYFWTVDGEFIKDPEGNKIPASSPNAPQIRPNGDTGMFEIYFEEVGDWIPLGPGMPYCIFKNIENKDDEVIFTMADDSQIIIPKTSKFVITLENKDILVGPNKFVELNFTVVGGDAQTEVEALGTGGYQAKLQDKGNNRYGLTVSVPAQLGGKVILIAVNGKGETAAKIVTFDEAIMAIEPQYIGFAPCEGAGIGVDGNGEIVFNPETMVSIPYRSNLPCSVTYDDMNAMQWCVWANDPMNPMMASTKAVPVTDKEFLFAVAPNDTPEQRFTTFMINADKNLVDAQMFAIVQLGPNDPPLPKDGRMDNETFNGGEYSTSRGTYTTTAGWKLDGGSVYMPYGEYITYPQLWMETSKWTPGTLTSPLLENGLTKLKLSWFNSITEKGVQFKINILDEAGKVLCSKEIKDDNCIQYDPKITVYTPDVQVKGKYRIQIINNYKMKDAYNHQFCITELTWKPFIDMQL